MSVARDQEPCYELFVGSFHYRQADTAGHRISIPAQVARNTSEPMWRLPKPRSSAGFCYDGPILDALHSLPPSDHCFPLEQRSLIAFRRHCAALCFFTMPAEIFLQTSCQKAQLTEPQNVHADIPSTPTAFYRGGHRWHRLFVLGIS